MSKAKKIILGIVILIILVVVIIAFNLIKRKLVTNDKYILKYLTKKYNGIEFERVEDYEDYLYKYRHIFSSGDLRRNGKLGLIKLFTPVGEEGEEFLVYQYYSGEIKDEYKYKIEYIWREKYDYNENISTEKQRKSQKTLYEFLNPKIEELLDGIEYSITFNVGNNPSEITLKDYFGNRSGYRLRCRIYISEKELKEENLPKYYNIAEGIKKYIEEVYGPFEGHYVFIRIYFVENKSFEEMKKYNYNILEQINGLIYRTSSFTYESKYTINDKGEIVEEIPSYEKFLESYLEY